MALVKTGSDITRRILGFAKGGRYDIETSDLNDVVKNSTNMFARTKKEITIHEKYERGLWTVDVDRGQIAQVLLNLYVNASDAMPEGGNLYIETRNMVLSKQLKTAYEALQDRYVRVTITDTGTGMDEATKQRIFEPFFSTKERGRGTGLGLSSVYGIIKSHGGFIRVSSEKRKGTTFELYFSVSGRKLSLLQSESTIADAPSKGSETILLVDDESVILDVGGEVLTALGYNVVPAISGKEAIEILRQTMDESGRGKEKALKPDLVILDMIMPEMGGAETFDAIKKINPDIKVLLASGYSIEGQATKILASGCDGFIQKPYSMQQISRKIREILES
jgi:CheY-like chemotaxis protein